jgi:Secretion system C-terminal sorting domain
MPKFIVSGIFCLFLLSLNALGQESNGPSVLAQGCDTINFPFPVAWGNQNYQLSQPNSGYLTGTSTYGNKEYAHFFDLSAQNNQYLTRCFIRFAIAATGNPANLNKVITIRVYDGTSNLPGGTILGSTTTTLGNIKNDYQLNDKTDIVFPTAIALPASKKFFIGVDMSTLSWNTDSLSIRSSQAGTTPSRTWARNPDASPQWYDLNVELGFRLSLQIHPFVSPTPQCQVELPIDLESFNGTLTQKGHLLVWNTATEQLNKGFFVEYASNNQAFKTIGFVASAAKGGNSSLPLQYSFLYQPIDNGSESVYRLKQQDLDGAFTYSKQISIRNAAFGNSSIGRLYPNPAVGTLTIDWVKPLQKNSQLRIIDANGRILKLQALENPGKQTTLATASLATGFYLLQVLDHNKNIIDTEKFWID